MEKKQYEICIEILKRLNKVGVLKEIILIGSWCIPFYKEYFKKIKYLSSIRTRDIDFLIPAPSRIKTKVDIPNLLKDLGFIVGFKGTKGYIRLEHPQIIVEFLVFEKGRGLDKPYPLPRLGLNAQALRFLNFLSQNTIHIKIENIPIVLPHPANFALHKLIILQRRRNLEKAMKDKDAAIKILRALIRKGDLGIIRDTFHSIPQKWQKKIYRGLEGIINAGEILKVLE